MKDYFMTAPRQTEYDMKQPYRRINRKEWFAKPDILLVGLLLLAGAVSLLAVSIMNNRTGTAVSVTADGKLYGTYDLFADQTVPVEINGTVTNILQISDGKAKMIQADCPDQLCVHQNAVSGRGGTIVCLPNKVVVEVKGEAAQFDSISR